MKPQNHPFAKENHLNQTFMTLGSILLVQGVELGYWTLQIWE